MKKLLFSLVLIVAFLPFAAKAQTNESKATHMDEISVCDSLVWIDNNVYKTDTNVFYYVEDTLHVLVLTVNHSYELSETVTADCSYFWGDSTIIDNGIYTHKFESSEQCDSIVHLTITFTKIHFDTLPEVFACDQYEWNGRILTESGVYFDTVNDEDTRCLLISVLPLTITTSILNFDTVELCGDYQWFDDILTTSGDYTHTIVSSGCDSVYYLNLTIFENYDTVAPVNSCGSYKWNKTGKTYTVSGIYTYVDTNSRTHCVSHTTISINITTLDTIEGTPVDTSKCERILYRFQGDKQPINIKNDTTISRIIASHTLEYCHDSLATVNFHIKAIQTSTDEIDACDYFEWNVNNTTRSYTRSTVDTVKMLGRSANGCDSLAILKLTLAKSPIISSIEGHWHLEHPGETAILFATIDQENISRKWQYWKDNTSNLSFADTLVVDNVTENIDVNLYAESVESFCFAEAWITILVGVGIDDAEQTTVSLYPNPTTKKLNIETSAAVESISIYNMIGQQMMKILNVSNQYSIDLSSLSNGTYNLRIELQNGQFVNRKFVVSK